jgi:hypothetical protein
MLLLVHRLCKEFNALPSQVLAEDGALMLQLLEVRDMVAEAEAKWQERALRRAELERLGVA